MHAEPRTPQKERRKREQRQPVRPNASRATLKTKPPRYRYFITLPTPLLILMHCLAGLLFCTGFGSPRLTDRDIHPTTAITTDELSAFHSARKRPELTSQATLLYDVDADAILLAENENEVLPVASLTKLMTALLVLESAAQDPQLLSSEVTVRDQDLVGGATMGLLTGERRTVEELLYGLLVPSGNDAATALARYMGSLQEAASVNDSAQAESAAFSAEPVDVFVARMNQRAAEMGLSQTNFVNPHGIDAPGHLSSAMDILVITRVALNHDLLRQIVRMDEIEVAGRTLRNTNQLLGSFPGADGVKTGTTPASGQSLVASITNNNHQVLMVILGSQRRYDDARSLYRYYEENYVWSDNSLRSVSGVGNPLNRIQHESGERWYLSVNGDVPARLLPNNVGPEATTYRRIQRPLPEQIWYRGMRIGLIEWRVGSEVIGTQTLTLR